MKGKKIHDINQNEIKGLFLCLLQSEVFDASIVGIHQTEILFINIFKTWMVEVGKGKFLLEDASPDIQQMQLIPNQKQLHIQCLWSLHLVEK